MIQSEINITRSKSTTQKCRGFQNSDGENFHIENTPPGTIFSCEHCYHAEHCFFCESVLEEFTREAHICVEP